MVGRKTDSKFVVDAGFVTDKVPMTAGMLRDMIEGAAVYIARNITLKSTM
jgi:hypothetical protein